MLRRFVRWLWWRTIEEDIPILGEGEVSYSSNAFEHIDRIDHRGDHFRVCGRVRRFSRGKVRIHERRLW